MILGFHKTFVPMVLDGSKRQTIRAGSRWKAGMRADLYTGAYRPAYAFWMGAMPFQGQIIHWDYERREVPE